MRNGVKLTCVCVRAGVCVCVNVCVVCVYVRAYCAERGQRGEDHLEGLGRHLDAGTPPYTRKPRP